MNNLVYIVMDSCRFDAWEAARLVNIPRLGSFEKRYSYASWTSPAHFTLLMGLTPHKSPSGVHASQIYKDDYLKWRERLAVENLDFAAFAPELSLAKKLGELGYRRLGRVSLPVLNRFTPLAWHFDDYKLMARHNDFAGMLRELDFSGPQPYFYFLNLGETHYPYMLGRDEAPVLHGLHGVLRRLSDASPKDDGPEAFFSQAELDVFRARQIAACEYLDGLIGELFAKCPPDTWFIITADHGELFGEDGYFGHGPICHPKVFEVPFIEGKLAG